MSNRRRLQPKTECELAARIVAGPFAGSVGVLVGTTPSGAAQVRLTVAGEEVTVQMAVFLTDEDHQINACTRGQGLRLVLAPYEEISLCFPS